ncbi:MAG: hypothetical protein J7L99_04110 [Planctomycetes bacterium]|nr:hypothetical protein [Planctomycetota bacterium]
MSDFREIIAILERFRRRIALCRAIESATVVSIAGAVEAFLLLTAWTLAGRFVPLAAIVVGLSFIPAMVLIVSKSLRSKVYRTNSIQVLTILILLGGGVFGLIEILTGRFSGISREALLLIIPVVGLIGFLSIILNPPSMAEVALWVDKRANLKERLITVLEAIRRDQDSLFSRAVFEQALNGLREKQKTIRNADYWSKTRATIGAAVIGISVAVSMLLITPLGIPSRKDNLLEISSRVGRMLRQSLDATGASNLESYPQLAEKIRRLEQIAQSFQSVSAIDAKHLQGKVEELDEITRSLRKAIEGGKLDADTIARLKTLISAIEQGKVRLIAQMSRSHLARGEDERFSTGRISKISPSELIPIRPSQPAEREPVMVYNPRYPAYAKPATSSKSVKESKIQAEITFNQAWLAARRRADEIVSAGAIPMRYRQLIRRFFQIER